MTRIIGGHAGSLRLATPGSGTRPTSDRVREAIFSRLEAHRSLDGLRVLDLFAGSGALGLEAASRGASAVTMVDNHQGALQVLRNNITALTAGPRTVLPHSPTLTALKSSALGFLHNTTPGSWDVVFLDPPYEHSTASVQELLVALLPHLADDAWVLVERSSRSEPIVWPEGYRSLADKTYGETVIYGAEKS
jgi:16S rRNA (guanine966-N2)-methyltransferase